MGVARGERGEAALEGQACTSALAEALQAMVLSQVLPGGSGFISGAIWGEQ